MSGPEAKIENKCVGIVNDAGWKNIKCDKVNRSWPDQLFLGPNRYVFFVEFKAPGEEPRDQQVDRIDMLRALGYTVYVCQSVGDFISLFSYERDVAARFSPPAA